ncbi:MAG: DNA-binding NarL/FixJ family response regulator [Verrucomicrobiales bacterium]|jgi:DNA-binding NarL/FixJ family response regulator
MMVAAPIATQHKIFILEDHAFLRMGLRQFLELEPDLQICGDFDRFQGAVEAILAASPDLVLLDISLPDGNGIDIIKGLRKSKFKGLILVLTMHDDALYAKRALRAGANGYAMKGMNSDSVLTAVRAVLAGEVFVPDTTASRVLKQVSHGSSAGGMRASVDDLSDRELQILEGLGSGLSTHQIAERLFISSKTVDAHRANIKKKVGINDMNELVRFAVLRFAEID